MKAKHMQISQNGYRHDCRLYVLHGNCDLMKLIGDKKLLMITEKCYYFMRVIHPASQNIGRLYALIQVQNTHAVLNFVNIVHKSPEPTFVFCHLQPFLQFFVSYRRALLSMASKCCSASPKVRLVWYNCRF